MLSDRAFASTSSVPSAPPAPDVQLYAAADGVELSHNRPVDPNEPGLNDGLTQLLLKKSTQNDNQNDNQDVMYQDCIEKAAKAFMTSCCAKMCGCCANCFDGFTILVKKAFEAFGVVVAEPVIESLYTFTFGPNHNDNLHLLKNVMMVPGNVLLVILEAFIGFKKVDQETQLVIRPFASPIGRLLQLLDYALVTPCRAGIPPSKKVQRYVAGWSALTISSYIALYALTLSTMVSDESRRNTDTLLTYDPREMIHMLQHTAWNAAQIAASTFIVYPAMENAKIFVRDLFLKYAPELYDQTAADINRAAISRHVANMSSVEGNRQEANDKFKATVAAGTAWRQNGIMGGLETLGRALGAILNTVASTANLSFIRNNVQGFTGAKELFEKAGDARTKATAVVKAKAVQVSQGQGCLARVANRFVQSCFAPVEAKSGNQEQLQDFDHILEAKQQSYSRASGRNVAAFGYAGKNVKEKRLNHELVRHWEAAVKAFQAAGRNLGLGEGQDQALAQRLTDSLGLPFGCDSVSAHDDYLKDNQINQRLVDMLSGVTEEGQSREDLAREFCRVQFLYYKTGQAPAKDPEVRLV